jgi:hypothetical protein
MVAGMYQRIAAVFTKPGVNINGEITDRTLHLGHHSPRDTTYSTLLPIIYRKFYQRSLNGIQFRSTIHSLPQVDDMAVLWHIPQK